LKQNRPLADIMAKRGAAMLALAPPYGLSAAAVRRRSAMTPGQIQRVRTSFASAVLQLDAVSAAFCRRLLGLEPGRRALFGGDPVVQRTKVGAALAGLVGSLGQLDRIRPQLQALGRERARQGIAAEDYAKLGEALIGALQEVLGEAFDAETRRAWIAAYGQIARTMNGAAPDPVARAA
jgi:hemoglobin-like flavoprotein